MKYDQVKFVRDMNMIQIYGLEIYSIITLQKMII